MVFSFLVPVYNTEKYLKQCVDSLLVQSGASFEILLLDDGSTDHSPQICDDYAAAYPDIVRVIHKENEGSFQTRRRGFCEAAGDWFVCIDSDDYVTVDLLKSVAQAINHNDGCDMVMFNHCYVDNQGIVTPSKYSLQDGMAYSGDDKQLIYKERLTTTNANSMCMRAIHRSIVDWNADYSHCGIRNMCDDALQVLPLYTNAQKIVCIDKPLYYYRKGDISTTSRITLEQWMAIHRSFVLEQPYADLWSIPASVSGKRYTKQLENICNCIRWLYHTYDENEDFSIPETIRELKEVSMFRECMAQYHAKYASTKYCAVSTPVIAMAADREYFRLLKAFFSMEKYLRKYK